MEKTIYIDDKPVRLKSTAATIYRYKQQFKKDYFAELLKLAKSLEIEPKENSVSDGEGNVNLGELSWDAIDHFDMEVLYNFVWVLAKSADHSIPEPIDWLDQFETFPIKEVFPQITELLSNTIQSSKKK